ncbi:MAG: 5'/3'-nucleotidase SurE, partial [Flavobacteriales bacterium]|nr:5'/3'-nucleotidase SurE [Flavobacteriales bacterium]
EGKDTDQWALDHGYASVVPTTFDLTAHAAMQELETWSL